MFQKILTTHQGLSPNPLRNGDVDRKRQALKALAVTKQFLSFSQHEAAKEADLHEDLTLQLINLLLIDL